MLKQRNDNLTKDEELELGRKIQAMKEIKTRIEAGYDNTTKEERRTIIEGEDALELLISNYYNLARDIAHKHHKRTGTRYAIEDLLQDAISALVTAAYNYDPSKNCKLSTYAFYGITKKVSSTINYQRLVRMPENKMGEYVQITKAQKAFNDLEEEEQEKYTDELSYVYENVDLKKSEVDLILRNMQPAVSLNAQINEGSTEMLHLIEDDRSHLETARVEIMESEVGDVIKELNDYERDLVAFEFGAFPASMSYQEFADKHGYTKRKMNIETKKVLKKMREIAELVGA